MTIMPIIIDYDYSAYDYDKHVYNDPDYNDWDNKYLIIFQKNIYK